MINDFVSASSTIGRVLIAWFNDCVLRKSGQIANPIIAMVDPVPYYNIHTHVYVCESINCKHRKYSQFAINRYSQLKTDLRYVSRHFRARSAAQL